MVDTYRLVGKWDIEAVVKDIQIESLFSDGSAGSLNRILFTNVENQDGRLRADNPREGYEFTFKSHGGQEIVFYLYQDPTLDDEYLRLFQSDTGEFRQGIDLNVEYTQLLELYRRAEELTIEEVLERIR